MELKKQDVGVWVKASEELPELYDNHERHFKVDGIKANGMFDLFQGEKTFEQKTFPGYVRFYENDFSRIEWLKPIKDVFLLTELGIKQILTDFDDTIPCGTSVEQFLESIKQ